MRKIAFLLTTLLLLSMFSGCGNSEPPADIAASTLPVYEFTSILCEGTGLHVTRLVTENVSCLHDYTLNVRQVKAAEYASLIVINGAGLEAFMADILSNKQTIDASENIELLESCHHHDDHAGDDHHDEHAEEADSHIWLSPANASIMANNICQGLMAQYPQHQDTFQANLSKLLQQIDALAAYGQQQLSHLEHRNVITFHDGFGYLAQWCDLEIVKAIEEESGAEASAAELIEIIELVRQHNIAAIFTEINGSTSAASVIAAETGVHVFHLDMAMSGESWFDAMYHNIDTLKEALG